MDQLSDMSPWEAISWTWAAACSLLDQGKDPRTYLVSTLMDDAKRDLGCSQLDPKRTVQIIVKLQAEGTHSWPNCPIEEVDYLRHDHRHVFHIEARKSVKHSDRDIEIIQLGHAMREYLGQCFWSDEKNLLIFGSRSCEMIAGQLVTEFSLDSCQVLEDGENGAIVTV